MGDPTRPPVPVPDSPLGRIREYYGVPAWPGRRVVVDGAPGVITGVQAGTMRLMVRFADGRRLPAHPTWRVEYVDEPGLGVSVPETDQPERRFDG